MRRNMHVEGLSTFYMFVHPVNPIHCVIYTNTENKNGANR